MGALCLHLVALYHNCRWQSYLSTSTLWLDVEGLAVELYTGSAPRLLVVSIAYVTNIMHNYSYDFLSFPHIGDKSCNYCFYFYICFLLGVLGIEQFKLGHENGGSQDHSRIM